MNSAEAGKGNGREVRKTRTVMVAGAFDILHPGHVDFLQRARRYGDRLFVSVTCDSAVTELKGHRPVFSQEERQVMVAALKPVDATAISPPGWDGLMRRIGEIGPDVFVTAADQKKLRHYLSVAVREKGWKMRLVRLPRSKAGKYRSSTAIREALRSATDHRSIEQRKFGEDKTEFRGNMITSSRPKGCCDRTSRRRSNASASR